MLYPSFLKHHETGTFWWYHLRIHGRSSVRYLRWTYCRRWCFSIDQRGLRLRPGGLLSAGLLWVRGTLAPDSPQQPQSNWVAAGKHTRKFTCLVQDSTSVFWMVCVSVVCWFRLITHDLQNIGEGIFKSRHFFSARRSPIWSTASASWVSNRRPPCWPVLRMPCRTRLLKPVPGWDFLRWGLLAIQTARDWQSDLWHPGGHR